MIASLFVTTFLSLCLLAAFWDLATLTIPNWLNGWIAFLFIPACILVLPGWTTAGWHLLAATLAFMISVALFSMRVFGGGDAKMIPAVILWIGPAGVMDFLYGMAIAGGLLAICVILARRVVPAHAVPGFAFETLQENRGVPYGIAIAAGAFMAAPASPLLTDFLSQIQVFS